MHVYQLRSSNTQVVAETERRIQICMQALKEVSKTWLVAKMVHTLFESILGNKHLEERLQKAAGGKHPKTKHNVPPAQTQAKPSQDPPKRKFDDMDIGFSNGPPAQQVSYERSRPQTPAATPSRDLPPSNGMPILVPQSSPPPHARYNHDAFMGGVPSRSATRPGTPFNGQFSYPGTPPDLFLVTRNSPGISHDTWQNFQPDQLFPADANLSLPNISPVPSQHHQQYLDPQLQHNPHTPMPQLQPASFTNSHSPSQTQMHQPSMQNPPSGGAPSQPLNVQHGQPCALGPESSISPQKDDETQQRANLAHTSSQNQPPRNTDPDTWSNSSRGQGGRSFRPL